MSKLRPDDLVMSCSCVIFFFHRGQRTRPAGRVSSPSSSSVATPATAAERRRQQEGRDIDIGRDGRDIVAVTGTEPGRGEVEEVAEGGETEEDVETRAAAVEDQRERGGSSDMNHGEGQYGCGDGTDL